MRKHLPILLTAAVIALSVPLAMRATHAPAPEPSVKGTQVRVEVGEADAPPRLPVVEEGLARRLLTMTNHERTARGLPALVWWPAAIAATTRPHTDAMVERQKLFHSANLNALLYSLDAQTLGENVAVGPTIEAIQRAFMRSPEHRANIVSRDYGLCAIWVVRDTRNVLWVTVTFGAPALAR